MQLFLFLNDLAGRWPLLDGAARLFYIGALPAMGTLLGAQLLLLPRSFGGASRSKTALAVVLALVLGALLVWGLDLLAGAWHLGNLSPRPWMTRRVNWLVVEPQDNSFPSLEVLFAFVIATASLLLNHKIGFVSLALALVFGIVRMFCGNNYFADVGVGALLGTGLFLLCAALVRRHVPFGVRARALSVGSGMVGATLGLVYVFAMTTPRFSSKLGFSSARAASTTTSMANVNAANANQAVRGAPTLFGEGEESASPDGEGRAEQVALAKRSSLFLPDVEAYLRGKLVPLARPLSLLDVEVAPVKAGVTSFRCAAVRFQADTTLPDARRVVANCAGRLARATFALDSHMQNVDIICVARDGGRNLDKSAMIFPGDEVPIFTASVQRKNVVLTSPAWLNAPSLDGGMWLRARSRLYINERALPPRPEPTSPTPPTSTPAPTNSLRLAPNANANASRPSAPQAKARSRPSARVAPQMLRPSLRPVPPSTVPPSTAPTRTTRPVMRPPLLASRPANRSGRANFSSPRLPFSAHPLLRPRVGARQSGR